MGLYRFVNNNLIGGNVDKIEKLEYDKLQEYENYILELIDFQDDFTRSDLQGMVMVIAKKIYNHK